MESVELAKVASSDTIINKNKKWKFYVPLTYKDLRRCYTKGKHSVYENTPHPHVGWFDGDHSYTPPNHIVADLLAHEVEIDEQWCYEYDEKVDAP